ncbi:hypothetical protein [Bosea vaviloviae]|uniref:Uncharacterized protein n=1 Tax=Bosea vaviloviae TaxID=1526658 RepID=A0A0N0M7I3_9HYPH|nr:hypothetical protein [Bosea vaviloviae]KPH74071.1 hypothetical protein AE618_25980 [Bosea vaviloviae]
MSEIAAMEVEALVARLLSEATAMHIAPAGEVVGETFHAENWANNPHRVLYDAVKLIREAADALARLTAELARERQETIAWRSAFQAVTPGGSEFQSPKAVREWADMLKTNVFNAKKSAVLSERRALTAEAALEAVIARHGEWRQCMPADWEGDPLSDAVAAAIRARSNRESP